MLKARTANCRVKLISRVQMTFTKTFFVLHCRFLLTLNTAFIFKTDFSHNSQGIYLLLMVSLTWQTGLWLWLWGLA